MPKRPKKNSGPQYGGPGRGTTNNFFKHFYLTSRYLNCEHCGRKVFSSKIDSSKASLMLRDWAHSKICKEMRAARGIVVDRMLSKHSLDWRDTLHLGISDSNEKQLCWSWRATWWRNWRIVSNWCSSSIHRRYRTDRRCMVYIAPAVTSEGIVFSKAALTTLEENVQTKDPYVVDVKSDIAEVQWQFLSKFKTSADKPPIIFRNRNQKESMHNVNPLNFSRRECTYKRVYVVDVKSLR